MPAPQKKKMPELFFKLPGLADMKVTHDKRKAETAKLEELAGTAPAQPKKGG
jgi:hypothetical protein